jgi:hypothetical protein
VVDTPTVGSVTLASPDICRRPRPRALSAFTQISLDGCYCDARGDMSFAHKPPDDLE